MAAPILNLDTLADRATVVINGKEYWLLTPEILPPLHAHDLQRLCQRARDLGDKADDLTDKEREELGAIPNRICRLVLEADDTVHQALDDRQRTLIAQVAMTTFQNGLRMPAFASPGTMPESPSSGANGSPGSSGSTQA